MSNGLKFAFGAAGFIVIAFVGLVVLGLGMYEGEVCDRLKASTVITDRLGQLTSCESRLGASGAIRDPDTFVFAVEGPRGVGKAYVQSTTGDDGLEVFHGILLQIGSEEIHVEGVRPPTT